MFYQTEHCAVTGYFQRESGENFSYAPHLHRSFELILLTEGTMTVTVDGVSQQMCGGQATLVFPNQVHALASSESKHVLFIFPPRIIQSFYAEKQGKLPKCNVVTLPPQTTREVLSLTKDSSLFRMKGALYTVCALFDENAEYRNAETDRQDLFSRILTYVENHFQEDCTLNTLAGTVGYNPEYLSRFFRKKMGIPYNHYLNMRRINHAVYLLNNSDESCLNCALECGYISLRSFNRNFKKHLGLSPQQYREENRK